MNKSIQRIGIIASVACLMACSNSDKKNSATPTGTATFFHYVIGSSTLELDSPSNDRGLGEVDFQSFGNNIPLRAKTWDLAVTDIHDASDWADDEPLLEDVSFPVVRKRSSIHALIGNYADSNIELVNLTLAYDEEAGNEDEDNNGIADDRAQYINFAHIHSDLGDLDVYLVDQDHSATPLNTLMPDNETVFLTTVSPKTSSLPIRLMENTNKYYVRIALSSDVTKTEIYNSGLRTLDDNLEQTIIIAPYVGTQETGSQITAFYFGDGQGEKWLAADSVGQVRVFNALTDSIDLDFTLSNSDPAYIPQFVDASLAYNQLSSFESISTQFVSYSLKPEEMGSTAPFISKVAPVVNVEDGESYTVVMFGNLAAPASLVVPEDDNLFTDKATITFTNAGYIANIEERYPYNIHFTIPGEHVTASSVDIASLAYRSYGKKTLNAGNTYEVTVTDLTNENSLSSNLLSVTVEGGENIHVVFIESLLGGYELVRLIGDASPKRSTITSDSATATAGGPGVEITVQAKDSGANKLTSGGDVVTLSSSTTGALTVNDEGNGKYSATLTNASAESVIITGTINGDPIADDETVVFTAP